MNQLITLFITIIDRRKPFSFQAKYFSALGSRWYFDLCLAVYGGNLKIGSEYCIRNRNMEVVHHIQAVSLQVFMLLFFYQNDQVAG
jgi:hypothetical protein